MKPQYSLDKIKFATDPATFKRGIGLYEKGKVTEVEEALGDYSAIVLGTEPYRVFVSGRRYSSFHCTCYVGQKDRLCKHVVALALHAVMEGQSLKDDDNNQVTEVKCSDKREELSKEELTVVKKSITEAMRYIKPYRGPSKIWFAYQDSLLEGCNRLRAIVSQLPATRQSAELLVKLLLRLDKKLSEGGVDDSDGAVGNFICEAVELLKEFARIEPDCVKAFKRFRGKQTCFGWEEPLMQILDDGV